MAVPSSPRRCHRIDGKALAEEILLALKPKIAALPNPPGLAAILIGDDPASTLYVRNKKRACQRVGITFHDYLANDRCMPNATQAQVLEAIAFLNHDPAITGIIVQLPVPGDFSADALVSAVDPKKDVDGFHPQNIAKYLAGQPVIVSPLIAAIKQALAAENVVLNGRTVAILAKDGVLRKTLGKFFVDAGAHVAAAAPRDSDLAQKTQAADVVVSAVGKPGLITGNLLKPDAVVIDVGITRMPDGTFAGDVDAPSVEKVASAFTPTPGGIGPLTVAMLLNNVYELATA
ncbi:MAG: bifunctional 5,10-methylenetetrahydrofolate dehydrogenase/5,10-methenyltetrahydrofolate cyclohydrolase [Patescibacteria group bacterium]|nr:bifunctional 5,10-methylenetetrahydrofolate dehydrogenase/5,10-methenyltetrahydrofolate cyclohydrolase [Patescibacteria group bacterium]